MSNFNDKIIIENDINVNDKDFDDLKMKLLNGLFFQHLKDLNSNIILDCIDIKNNTSLKIKNIIDEDDDEIQIVKFNYHYEIDNDNIKLFAECLKQDDNDDEDFLYINFNDFILNISKNNISFIMSYNSKEYPKCVFIMIRKYFEYILNNFIDEISNKLF